MLAYYLSDLTTLLRNKKENDGWEVSTVSLMHMSNAILCCGQEVEATLHCVMSIQEAVPLEPNTHLSHLFSSDILGQLPTCGGHRVQRTMLGLIGIFFSNSALPLFTLLVKRFLRLMVHNPPCSFKRTPACRPELRGARAE
jgi:hypothetical protein